MSDIRQLDITADHAIQLDVPANTTALVTVNGGSTLYYSDADRTVAVATAQGSIVLNGSQTFTSPVWAKPAAGLTSITVLSTPITTPIGSLPVGVANGIAGLDGNATLSTDQIPVSVANVSSAFSANHLLDVSQGIGFATDYQGGDTIARSSYLPTFTKASSNPFMTIGASSMTSLRTPSPIFVGGIYGGPGPFGEWWRVYDSTDHEVTWARVGLMTCNSLIPETGTWIDRGPVYQDLSAGSNQCENPVVIYRPDCPINNQPSYWMIYNNGSDPNASATQCIKLATMTVAQSLIAESWTTSTINNGILIDVPADGALAWPSPQSYGYPRPFRTSQGWVMHCLISGVPTGAFGIARSRNGLPGTWMLDARPLWGGAHLMNDPAGRFNQSSHYIAWNTGQVFKWKGELLWIGLVFPFDGGGSLISPGYLIMSRISRDMRRLLDQPQVVFTSNQGWEQTYPGAPPGMTAFHSAVSTVTGPDNKTRLFYQGSGVTGSDNGTQAALGAFGIAVAA